MPIKKEEIMGLPKEKLVDIILELSDKIQKLEKELAKYKNPNTPPSSNKHLKPNTFGKQAKKNVKRGAPIGHIAHNKSIEPENYEDVDACECPNCHGKHVRDKKIFKRKTEEIEEPQKPVAKGALVHLKHCDDCNMDFIPPQNATPLRGSFGINLMVLVIFIKFLLFFFNLLNDNLFLNLYFLIFYLNLFFLYFCFNLSFGKIQRLTKSRPIRRIYSL